MFRPMKNPQDLPTGKVPHWTLGDRLRKARITAGIGLEEMAATLDVTPRTVSSYELDQTRPRRPIIREYALRTGVPIEWLDTGSDNGGHTIRYPLTVAA